MPWGAILVNRLLAIYFRSFLYRLWLGDYPLWVSFWLFFLVGQYVVALLILLLGAPIGYFFEISDFFAVLIILLLIFILYVLIATVGTWRSANKYDGSDAMIKATKSILFVYDSYLITLIFSLPFFFGPFS